MSTDPTPDRAHRATFTVTVTSRPDGGHYLGSDDFSSHVAQWIKTDLRDHHAIAEVKTAAESTVTPPPALTEAGRLRARVQVLQQDAERDRGLAKVGARCMREGHQGLIEQGRMTLEGWRFALSTALGLGTSAPWDAIHDRVKELAAGERDEQQAQQDGAEVLPASTAPLAAGFPLVKGNCPACRRASLFLGTGGYPTCSNHECPEPDAATTVLEQYGHEAHAPSHAWKVESPRRDKWASWGATYDDRAWAQERYESAVRNAPQRPFRLVRATTIHTVEDEYGPAAAPVAGQPPADTGEEAREVRAVSCSAVVLRGHHAPHDWEPQPGMDRVHCAGYPQEG